MLHKAFRILEAIALKRVNTIDSISLETGLPRSTVHRILQSLQKEGVVLHNHGKGYAFTPKLLSIGLGGIAERGILDSAIPIMRELSEVVQETISLNVICGLERVCVYRIEGSQPITRNIRIGSSAPLFIGSAGKVIASGLNRREQEKILDNYIASGVVKAEDTERLLNAVELVQRQGYATSVSERLPESASLAVPIKDVMGCVLAALSISTLESRLDAEKSRRFIELLIESAKQIQQSYYFAQ